MSAVVVVQLALAGHERSENGDLGLRVCRHDRVRDHVGSRIAVYLSNVQTVMLE